MQIHFVSYNTKYYDLSTSLPHDDGLAVLGVMLKVMHPSTPWFVFDPHSFSKVTSCEGIRIPESGKMCLWNPECGKFCFGIRPAQLKEYRLESRISVPLTKNHESSRNSRCRIHNPRIFQISLHGVEKESILLHKKHEFIFEEINSNVAFLCFILHLKFVERCCFFKVT